MFCINCGSQNVDVTNEANKSVFIERGEYHKYEEKYEEEFEVVVLQCIECKQEMCNLS